jgi:hypothetical protein
MQYNLAFIISKQQNLRDIRVTRPSHSAQTQKEVPLEITNFFSFFNCQNFAQK